MKAGALHRSPERQLMTPFPYSPPKMNAAFLRSGITATQRALTQYSGAMLARISCTTCAAAESRAASVDPIAAPPLTAVASTAAAADRTFGMSHLSSGFAATTLPRQQGDAGRRGRI